MLIEMTVEGIRVSLMTYQRVVIQKEKEADRYLPIWIGPAEADAITVEGRIQKPQAFYILQRSTLNFDELNRAETFVPKVEKSVEKDAF